MFGTFRVVRVSHLDCGLEEQVLSERKAEHRHQHQTTHDEVVVGSLQEVGDESGHTQHEDGEQALVEAKIGQIGTKLYRYSGTIRGLLDGLHEV